MASYFELPAQDTSATTARIEEVPAHERRQLGSLNLMSPAVTQILEHLEDEDEDSSSEVESLSDEENSANPDDKSTGLTGPSSSRQETKAQRQGKTLKPSSLSPNRHSSKASSSKDSAHVKVAAARAGGNSSARDKPTHLARFHSLRSMLFQANIEDKMKTIAKEDTQKEEVAVEEWKTQHDNRQMHRPRTPETETKDALGKRIRTKIRRITSKDVPTMSQIGENDATVVFDDHAPTPSSDIENGQTGSFNAEDDNANINDSEIEELSRFVIRGKAAGSREAKANAFVPELYEDSDQESLGHSDVDDLVRWVSRKSTTREEQDQPQNSGYSDASTESDTEVIDDSSDEEEDADDLVRWISHRDGPRAGPVCQSLERKKLDSKVEENHEDAVPEIGRSINRYDRRGGEAASPVYDRADFLDEDQERGRSRSRASISPEPKQKNHLTDNDVDELVRWVSRRESKQNEQATRENDEQEAQLKRQEDVKKKQLGMTVDEGSLSHSDIKELVDHVRKTSLGDTADLEPIDSGTASAPMLERGDDGVKEIRREEEAKKQQLGMTVDEGSLSHSDVQDLIAHVRENDIRDDAVRVA